MLVRRKITPRPPARAQGSSRVVRAAPAARGLPTVAALASLLAVVVTTVPAAAIVGPPREVGDAGAEDAEPEAEDAGCDADAAVCAPVPEPMPLAGVPATVRVRGTGCGCGAADSDGALASASAVALIGAALSRRRGRADHPVRRKR